MGVAPPLARPGGMGGAVFRCHLVIHKPRPAMCKIIRGCKSPGVQVDDICEMWDGFTPIRG